MYQDGMYPETISCYYSLPNREVNRRFLERLLKCLSCSVMVKNYEVFQEISMSHITKGSLLNF